MQPTSNAAVMVAPSSCVTYPVNPGKAIYPNFKPKTNLVLSIMQVILGSCCILFQIVGFVIHAPLHEVGSGIWGGIPFVIAGVFGILASKSKSRCTVITLMVMSIISAVLAGGMFINQTIALVFGGFYGYYGRYRYYSYDGVIAINVLLLLCALTEMIVAIVQSAFCCGATCGSSQSGAATQVMYVNQPPVAQSNVVYSQGMPQNQPQQGQGQQLFIFSQGQFMPVVALPQGSFAPTMVAAPSYPGAGTPVPAMVNPVPQAQFQPQPPHQSYPQSVPPSHRSDHQPAPMQMTTAQPSPPPAYVSNPDLQQPQPNVDESGRTNPEQPKQAEGQWEKFHA